MENSEKFGEIVLTALNDGLSTETAHEIADACMNCKSVEPTGGFYDKKDDPNENQVMKEVNKLVQNLKTMIDTTKNDYQEMQEKVSKLSSNDDPELLRKYKHLAGKTELLSGLLTEKEDKLEDFIERLDFIEDKFRSSHRVPSESSTPKEVNPNPNWSAPFYIPRPTKKAGINPFRTDRDDFAKSPENVEYIDISAIEIVSCGENDGGILHSFPGS